MTWKYLFVGFILAISPVRAQLLSPGQSWHLVTAAVIPTQAQVQTPAHGDVLRANGEFCDTAEEVALYVRSTDGGMSAEDAEAAVNKHFNDPTGCVGAEVFLLEGAKVGDVIHTSKGDVQIEEVLVVAYPVGSGPASITVTPPVKQFVPVMVDQTPSQGL